MLFVFAHMANPAARLKVMADVLLRLPSIRTMTASEWGRRGLRIAHRMSQMVHFRLI